jgi:hypothetical protein
MPSRFNIYILFLVLCLLAQKLPAPVRTELPPSELLIRQINAQVLQDADVVVLGHLRFDLYVKAQDLTKPITILDVPFDVKVSMKGSASENILIRLYDPNSHYFPKSNDSGVRIDKPNILMLYLLKKLPDQQDGAPLYTLVDQSSSRLELGNADAKLFRPGPLKEQLVAGLLSVLDQPQDADVPSILASLKALGVDETVIKKRGTPW